MKLKLAVTLSYKPQSFSHRHHFLSPATWTAETFGVPGTSAVYGLDQYSPNEAIHDLISQLKSKGFTGTMSICRTHTTADQEKMDEAAEQALANDPVYQSYWK